VLEDDAEVMSDEQLAELLADEQSEILSLSSDARHRALLVPPPAGLLGSGSSVYMRRAVTA